MAQRVRLSELEEVSNAHSYDTAATPHLHVTEGIVDRAVEETLDGAGVSDEVARVMRDLLGGDTNSAVAKAYYHAKASVSSARRVAGVTKPVYEVPYVLTEGQAADLVAYAPDFEIRFRGRESHDHPMAAACRAIDRALVDSRLPPGAPVSHVGAAVLPLMRSGLLGNGHHGCAPVIDSKDQVRGVMAKLQARKLSCDLTKSANVRAAAVGYLNKAESFVCDKRVQECSYRTPVITSVHVYDVPMQDWAGVMDRKRARLLEGCVLFPANLFDKCSGEMSVAGARYEVDAVQDKFRMGFVGSPAWWYEHRLSDYLRYGVDQVLSSGGGVYSYKVVERRGDTLFFRILRVSPNVRAGYQQVYRVPGVEMVRVNGFPMTAHKQAKVVSHARRTYLFPRVLWEDMLAHAKECAERGTLTPERMFNYYRTVAPRQSVNAVVVSGGVEVHDLTLLAPLVVHVALFAFQDVRRVALESKHMLDSAMRSRMLEDEGTFYKLFAAFGDAVSAATRLTAAPFWWLAKLLDKGAEAVRLMNTYDWALEAQVQVVNSKLLLPCFSSSQEYVVGEDFSPWYRDAAPMDLVSSAARNSKTAQFLLDVLGDDLPADVLKEARSSASSQERDTVASAKPAETVAESVAVVDDVEVLRRKASVAEAIDECRAEAAKSEASCADQYRTLFTGKTPNSRRMADYREMYHNPEFWYVSFGVVEKSFSGAPVAGFMHSAVYCPVPFGGSRLLLVSEEEYKGMSCGEYVERVHYKVANPDFTGWVYTNDSLLIYNGPALVEAMEAAMHLPMDFSVNLNQGPPGCGKTTTIVKKAELDDIVLVPVKKAARETAQRLAAKSSEFSAVASKMVRTLDSYLVNVLRNRKLKALRPQRLLADEAFMAREGRWLAAAAMLGVASIEAFGDVKQIPHVPRAECPSNYVRLRCDSEVEEFVSYRCPPQLVACWGSVYDWKVRSASKRVGVVKRVDTSVGMEVPDDCVMMGMYQADKKVLQEKYSRYGDRVRIMTVHESEGNTYKHVWLHRFDTRKRTDNFSLYDKQEYALVAMSRSTHSFVYVSPDLGDQVSKFIKQGQDPRRVAAASRAETAGVSMEFG